MRLRMTAVVVAVWIVAGFAPVSRNASTALLRAQADRGGVAGTVIDQNGAVLPGGTVTLAGPEQRKTVTDAMGLFSFENVRPGAYELRAELAGFLTSTQKIAVAAGR